MKRDIKILILVIGSLLVVVLGIFRDPSVRAAVPGMIMVYSKLATDNTPFSRVWDGGAWGNETTASPTALNDRQLVVKCARFKEECLLVALDSVGYISAQQWNGSVWSATTTVEQLNTAGDSVYRPFDLEYENGTDKAMLVMRGGDNADPVYRTWDGSSWSASSTIDIPTTGAPRFIELARQRFSTSTRIAMIIMDNDGTTGGDVYGMEWNGSSWSNMTDASAWDATTGTNAKKMVDVAYETASGDALFAWVDSVADTINYRTWNGTTLSDVTTLTIAAMDGAGEWLRLASDPLEGSNYIMLGEQDAVLDLNTREWDGSAWDTATEHPEHDNAVEDVQSMNFDIQYMNATSTRGAWLVYADGAGIATKLWQGSWSSIINVTGDDDSAYVSIGSSLQNQAVSYVVYEDNDSGSDDIDESHIIGPAIVWSAQAAMWAGAVIAQPAGFRIDMAPSRFYTYPTFNQVAYRFFENADNTTGGTALAAAQDIPATTTSNTFRLRILLDDTVATSTAPEHDVVLQYATMSVACDTGFSGESYATVTPATSIAFYDNPSVVDGATASSNAQDPSHSGHTRKFQEYAELNGATTTTDTPPGMDAIWDFSLFDNDGATTGSYCFRLVKGNGALLSSYTVIPQIDTYTAPTISTAYNEIFDYGGAASSSALITVTDPGGVAILASQDLRIPIATSSINMIWDTSVTNAVLGGSASTSKVTSSSITYEGGGSVAVVDVTTDFAATDALTISGLKFTSFNTATSSTAGYLGVFARGPNDQYFVATTTQTASIVSNLIIANHTLGQIGDQWDTQTPTTTTHYRFKLTANGEDILMGTTTFALSGISGISASDITSAKLYVDVNSNGYKDASDAVATTSVRNIAWSEHLVSGSATDQYIESVIYNTASGKYVAAGRSGAINVYDAYVWESTDLTTWTPRLVANGTNDQQIWDIIYAPDTGKYVVVGNDGAGGTADAYEWDSTNLTAWTAHLIEVAASIQETYTVIRSSVDSKYVTAGYQNNSGSAASRIHHAGDALTPWTHVAPGTLSYIYDIIYNSSSGKYVGAGTSGSSKDKAYITESTDLSSWTPRLVADNTGNQYLKSILYDSVGAKYVVGGVSTEAGNNDAYSWYSSDLTNWSTSTVETGSGSQSINSIDYNNADNRYIVAGGNDKTGKSQAYAWETSDLTYPWTAYLVNSTTSTSTITSIIYATTTNKYIAGGYSAYIAGSFKNSAMVWEGVPGILTSNIYDGSVSISGSTGSITFATSTPYTIKSGQSVDYLLYLTASNLVGGDTMIVSLPSTNASTTGVTSGGAVKVGGSASDITHRMDQAIVSGNVYIAEDKSTNISSGHTISLSINGAATSSVQTTSGGAFTFSTTAQANDTLTLFLENDATYRGTLVTQSDGTDLTGLAMYTDKVVLHHQTAGPMTDTLLRTAKALNTPYINYSTTTNSITFADGMTTWIEDGKTYTPGASENISMDNLIATGTASFVPNANDVTVRGNWYFDSDGTFTTTGTVTFATTSAPSKTIDSGGKSFYKLTVAGPASTWTLISNALTTTATTTLAVGTLDTGSNLAFTTANLDIEGGTLVGNASTITISGGAGSTLFKRGGTSFVPLHDFIGGASDSASPYTNFVVSGSTLYGMTNVGGSANKGTIYSIGTDGSGFTILHTFVGGGSDGSSPYGTLILSGSTLYGMTYAGGDSDKGTIFSIATSGASFTLLHEFAGGASDGALPLGDLTISGSTLYGMTLTGGSPDLGVVFSIATSGASFTLLHTFITGSGNGGFLPYGTLALSGSTLYGATSAGETSNKGSVFSMDISGTPFTTLHAFAGGASDGDSPQSSVTLSGSTLYGMTWAGGDSDKGTIYSIGTDGSGFTLLHEFAGGASDGDRSQGALTLSGSTLYGMTPYGGSSDLGVAFSIATSGASFTLLHTFVGGVSDGASTWGSLTLSGSILYGTAFNGGNSDLGMVFYLDPASNGTFTGGTSNVVMSPDATVNLTSGTFTSTNAFYDLTLSPTITSGRTYTFGSGNASTTGNFTINPNSSGSNALTVNMGAGLSTAGTTTVQKTNSATANLDTTASNYPLWPANISLATGGTLTGNTSRISLSGNWTNALGTFTAGNSTTTFSGTATSTITGTTTFNHLEQSTSGKTLAFHYESPVSPIFTFAGNFLANGAVGAGNKIKIKSDSAGNKWLTHFNSTQNNSTYLEVKDSGCDGGTSNITLTDGTSVNVGNNSSCWVFPSNTAPAVSNVSFNGNSNINLVEGTYKWATTSLLITDTEYCSTITSVTAKAYLASTTNSGTLCSPDDLNCYQNISCTATTTGNTCGASDPTVEYDCGFKLWYIARPTDTGDWASSIWSVSATATDDGALTGTATNTDQLVDVNSLSAFSVTPTLDYDTIAPATDSGSTNATSTLTNTGNVDIDPRLSGADMNSADDTLLVGQQEYDANPFVYGVGTALSSSPTLLNITLPAPTATTTPITDTISWGLGVPGGKKTGAYSGLNTLQI